MTGLLPTSPHIMLAMDSFHGNGTDFLHGISEYADANGPWLFNFEAYTCPEADINQSDKNFSLSLLPDFSPSGIITSIPCLTKKYTTQGIPTILASIPQAKHNGHFSSIVWDNKGIGKTAAEYFINRGYRHFAFCGYADVDWSIERGLSFAQYLDNAGHKIKLYELENRSKLSARKKELTALTQWLKQLPRATGVFTCNDKLGHNLVQLSRIEQIEIPEELSVLGVDDDYAMCNFCSPPLSSIKLDWKIAGYETAELLDMLMAGEKTAAQKIIVRPLEIRTRQSTDIMAVRDENVNKAVRFIHEHSRDYIQVNDVVAAAALSRRRLQEKFCSILGRTISDEIKRVRTENISHRLLKTDLSVQQIAWEFGYNDLPHIARFFKKQTGLTPTEYRRKYGRS